MSGNPASERPEPGPITVPTETGLLAPGRPDADLVMAEPAIAVDEIDTARRYADAARAASTRRAYASDWRFFARWCTARGLDPLPAHPGVIALFLAAQAQAGLTPPTLGRRLAAIGFFHRRAGLPPPHHQDGAGVLREVLAGIRRSHGVAPAKKRAADAEVLRALLDTLPGDDLRSVRDRAVLALGMAGAFRRSELVALTLADLERVPEGLRLTIRRSKTDPEAAGATIAIPDGTRLHPAARLEAWIARAGITDGFLFRRLSAAGAVTPLPMSDRAVARLVQARAAAAGYPPEAFAGHSLRAGFLTAAARTGASVFKMREVSRHKSMQVLADYVRDAELFRDHAGSGFL